MKMISKRTVNILLITALVTILLYLGFTCYSSEVTKNLDSYVYELPYEKGSRFEVVQGYGGLFSHFHIAAIDFAMPEGTPVCAAREGIVYAWKDDSNEGGPFEKYKKKANYIIIKHSDNSYGCCWHLKKDGVVAKSGRVKKGQLIGYSGSTGFVLRPHLHFSIKRKLNYERDSFVRTKFRTSCGIGLLSIGVNYVRN